MIADYATTTLTTGDHPLGLLRGELRGRGAVHSGELARLPHGSAVRIGGLVVARQRPGTAKGVIFVLMEDEHGTINLIVPPPVYERDRLVVRTEPLVLAHGRLERHASGGGAINIVVARMVALQAPGVAAKVTELAPTAPAREHGPEVGDIGAPGSPPGSDDLAAAGTDDVGAPASGRFGDELAAAGGCEPGVPATGPSGEDLAATGTEDFRAVAPAAMSFAQGRRR
jgi:error-prone DNA polymerase